MMPFPGRDVSVSEAYEALDNLEECINYNCSPAQMQQLALVRLVLRRQSMLLAACNGWLRAKGTGLPTERQIMLSIRGIAPVGSDQVVDQVVDQLEEKPVPQPAPHTRQEQNG